MAECSKRVYADRSLHLGDPAFHDVPTGWLLSDERLGEIARGLDRERATPSRDVAPGQRPEGESEETTHFSIVDAEGNAVSCTYTLNASFGAAVICPGTGLLLNDQMDDFAARPGTPNLYGLVGGDANAIAPGKRMLSSMSPTVVRKDGKNWLVLGSPGGSTIITTVFQVLVSRIDHGLSLADAVALRRVHHQWLPDSIAIESNEVYGGDVLEGLRRRGHTLAPRRRIGRVHAIEIDPSSGLRLGVADPRGSGVAEGR